jgi:hypothetical protein
MPRNRHNDSETTTLKSQDIEEDYLDVDKPLSGQNYYCISFVSPEKVLEQKEKFMYYHYERSINKKLSSMLDEAITKLIDNSKDGNVDVADIISLKKSINTASKEYDVTFEKFKDMLEDFKFQNEEKIGEDFDKSNNFKTSVRGVKVRGVFDTKREADIRAAVLQRQDALFDVFVGQIGYWCPWDPNPQKIDDIEYMNNDLNKLVKEYKANEVKKDMFYQEQKTQRQKDVLSAEDRLKHQEGIAKMNEYRDSLEQAKKDGNCSSLGSVGSVGSVGSGAASLINSSNSGTTLDSLLNISDGLESPPVESSETKPQAITQSLELGGEDSKEITLDEEAKLLMSDDPWMQRKISQK